MREKAVGPDDGRYEGESVQPIDLIESMNLGFHEGSIVKYMCRWKNKGGVEDLKKAQQYLGWLIAKAERKMQPEDDYRAPCQSPQPSSKPSSEPPKRRGHPPKARRR